MNQQGLWDSETAPPRILGCSYDRTCHVTTPPLSSKDVPPVGYESLLADSIPEHNAVVEPILEPIFALPHFLLEIPGWIVLPLLPGIE